MGHWSDAYIGINYQFGGCDPAKGTDCLRLTEIIYRKEKGYSIDKGNDKIDEKWYERNPDRLIKKAIAHGEVIDKIEDLREFDAVFFKINNVIRHLGVMIDNYGHFIHQMIKRPSRVDDIRARHWQRRFYCGIRPKFTE